MSAEQVAHRASLARRGIVGRPLWCNPAVSLGDGVAALAVLDLVDFVRDGFRVGGADVVVVGVVGGAAKTFMLSHCSSDSMKLRRAQMLVAADPGQFLDVRDIGSHVVVVLRWRILRDDRADRVASVRHDLCRIAGVDTLKASKMLKAWVEQGVLEQVPDRAKRNTAYIKPAQPVQGDLLSTTQDNKL